MREVIKNQTTTKSWRIVYTRSNWEKKTDLLLKRSGLNSFCPVVSKQRKWADRKKTVEVPLFNSYLFVEVDAREETKVLQTEGIIAFVKDFGKTAEISGDEIIKIRNLVDKYEDLECISGVELKKGDLVNIDGGTGFDLHCEVSEIKRKHLVLVMKSMDCCLIATIKVDSQSHMLKRTRIN